MNLAEFAIKQRTFISFFCVLCIVAGTLSYFKLGKLEDPSFTVKSAVIVTLYRGGLGIRGRRASHRQARNQIAGNGLAVETALTSRPEAR